MTVLTCAGEAEQAAAIAAELRRARLENGVRYGDMAVLVRSGRRQLAPILRSLTALGIPVEVAGDEIPLAQAPAVRPLLLALSITAAGRVEPDEASRLLTSPLAGFDALGLRRLVRQWRAAHPEDGRPRCRATRCGGELPRWLATADPTPMVERLRDLLRCSHRPARSAAGDRWIRSPGRCGRAAAGRGNSVGRAAGGALGSRADADLDAVCAFFDTAAEADQRGGAAGVRAFLAELAGQQIPPTTNGSSRLRGRGVQVLTAHRARGREWELVVVAGVQEGNVAWAGGDKQFWTPRR